jgi:hypothetical protein
MDETMIIEFSSPANQLKIFRDIKNDLIGNDKKVYFNKGLIETVVPLLNDRDPNMIYECLVILNSFLIDFPDAIDVFHVFAQEIKQSIHNILNNQFHLMADRLNEMTLRLIRNLLESDIIDSIHIPSGVLAR